MWYNSKKGEYIGVDILFSLALFFLCPALAIVSTISHIYRGKYGHLTILALCISTVALFTPPFADIYRHTLLYFEFESHSYPIIQSNGHDYIFYTLTNIFAQNEIPFEFVSFIFVFVCYQISFFIFYQVATSWDARYWDKNKKFTIFLLFLLMVPFIAIINGLRMATAAYIAFLAWYYIYNKRYFIGTLIYLISLATHFGSWIFLPTLLIPIIPHLRIDRQKFIFISLGLFVAGGILLHILPSSIIEMLELEDQVTGYMEHNEERFDATMSVNGRIAMYLERLPLVIVFILILFNRIKLDNRRKFIIYTIIWLAILYHPFIVLFCRYAFFAIPLLVYIYIDSQKGISRVDKVSKILLCACIIMTLSYVYGYRETFLNTHYHKMFFPSLYTIPSVDTHELFEDALIPK